MKEKYKCAGCFNEFDQKTNPPVILPESVVYQPFKEKFCSLPCSHEARLQIIEWQVKWLNDKVKPLEKKPWWRFW